MNESYEEYIRSILGYPRADYFNSNETIDQCQNCNNMNYYSNIGNTNFDSKFNDFYNISNSNGFYNTGNSNGFYNNNFNNDFRMENREKLENCYPEIYKLVYPMVLKKCQNSRATITADDIDNMTDEIYYALENKEGIELNINLTNNVSNSRDMNLQNLNEKRDKSNNKTEIKIKEKTEKRETRQINRGLRDLIKILLLRELLNSPGQRPPMPGPGPYPPVRPPMPGPGPRPPVRPPLPPRPPMPGSGGPRPPIRPRNNNLFNENDFEPRNSNDMLT